MLPLVLPRVRRGSFEGTEILSEMTERLRGSDGGGTSTSFMYTACGAVRDASTDITWDADFAMPALLEMHMWHAILRMCCGHQASITVCFACPSGGIYICRVLGGVYPPAPPPPYNLHHSLPNNPPAHFIYQKNPQSVPILTSHLHEFLPKTTLPHFCYHTPPPRLGTNSYRTPHPFSKGKPDLYHFLFAKKHPICTIPPPPPV